MSLIVWIGEPPSAPPVGLVGGKGLGLDLLQRNGLQVPEAFVITTDCFRRAVTPELRDELNAIMAAGSDSTDVGALERASARAQELLYDRTAGHAGESAIRAAFAQLQERTGCTDLAVAVRSSSAAEDAADRSFAGEHDTYLWVHGADEVCEHVRRCWASLFTTRASAYRADSGAGGEDAMAVVVQRMVDVRAAGVFMTLHPATGDRSKVVIESLWGLGELLVSGAATPDRFTVDKITGEIVRRELADKPERMTRDPVTGRGTSLVPVPEQQRSLPSLSDAEISQLVEMGRIIERLTGRPQDGEFAVANGEAGDVFLLQARPETVWSNRAVRRVGGDFDALSHVVSTLTGNLPPSS